MSAPSRTRRALSAGLPVDGPEPHRTRARRVRARRYTYTVARTDTWKEDADKYVEDAGSAVLWRKVTL